MISHHHRTIFVHIPKCGGQSVENAFLADVGLDWERRAPFLLYFNAQWKVGPSAISHLTAKDYTKFHYCTPKQYDDYYKFTVVRDPVSRLVSVYNYIYLNRFPRWRKALMLAREHLLSTPYPFERFLDDFVEPAFADTANHEIGTKGFYDGFYWFIRPQVDFLYDGDTCLVDDIIGLKSLNEGWSQIAEKSGVKSPLEHVNTSNKRVSAKDLDTATIDRVKGLYAADYDRLEF